MGRSTLPLFPTDDGWPYPDGVSDPASTTLAASETYDAEPDLDALELQADPYAFESLTDTEHRAVVLHFGLGGGTVLSMKELGPALGCTHAQAREHLGAAIEKLRTRLTAG